MEEEEGLEIATIFAAVEDPWIERTKQHRLGDILILVSSLGFLVKFSDMQLGGLEGKQH